MIVELRQAKVVYPTFRRVTVAGCTTRFYRDEDLK
jgi:hypothetical protein